MKLTKLFNYFYYLMHFISFDKHRNFRKKVIQKNKEKSNFYDYGESFFYQSMPCINLKGLRDTCLRINILKIEKYTNNKRILDIGTNIGAILLNMKENYIEGLGIEYNPKLIDIAEMIRDYKNKNKIKFICSDFINFDFKESFDVIFSFANHSTFDKGISDTKKYFEKIRKIISPGGVLLLESHSPLYENTLDFERIVDGLKKDFSVIDKGIYDFGNFYDKKRVFYVLKKNN
tara:strand:- start:444 stop:1139 length:696 start_codon:yes stop_codon:yes gene_type:complete